MTYGSLLDAWAKARPECEAGTRWHPLVYHCLDVAAVGELLLTARPAAAGPLAMQLGWSAEAWIRLLVFLLALHDIGKLSRAFQAKVPELWPVRLLGPLPTSPPRDPGHPATGAWLLRHADTDLFGALLPGWPPRDVAHLLAPFAGHHGRPVPDADIAEHRLSASEMFGQACLDAAGAAALDTCFAPFRDAFVLDGPGPRFLQDADELDGEAVPVAALLIDSPGANALKKNTDLFVKRGRVAVLSRAAAAIGLFTLSAYAPSGGAGHRTSLRGGGPLTTLLLPGSRSSDQTLSLWHQLWANVFWDEEWDDPASRPERVFPWLTPTRVSDKGQVTTPEDVHPAQAFFGAPRRIRLEFEANEEGAPCDLTGAVDQVVVRSYRTRPHGCNYAAWSLGHPLTPYYRGKATDPAWLPVHPQPGRLGYRDWVGLVLGDGGGNESTRAPAAAVVAAEKRLSSMDREVRRGTRLHAAGYDVDNMKSRGFVESEMPVRIVCHEIRGAFEVVVRQLVLGARQAQGLLSSAVRTALWDREAPGADAGVRALARDRFWDETEHPFHDVVAGLADALEAKADDEAAIRDVITHARDGWLSVLRRTTLAIFDALVPLNAIEERDAERLVAARRNLRSGLYGYGKAGSDCYAALGLPPPESKRKGSKV